MQGKAQYKSVEKLFGFHNESATRWQGKHKFVGWRSNGWNYGVVYLGFRLCVSTDSCLNLQARASP